MNKATCERNKRSAGNTRANAKAERARVKAAARWPKAGVAVIPDDDPRLTAAAAEAGRRFPEFLAALAARQPGDAFAVKVPFADDYGREFMWVTVSRVDSTHVVGRLDNRPTVVRAVRAGPKVRVPRKAVNDWLFVRAGEAKGGFTLAVVRDRMDGNAA